ncbi:MAG: single-stranded DNA-binding protein [Candidatus Yanofskybacteria bacterium]|nr:single-stranded DNA-binding protein [Candidatus Yanofskybacteria bacterium]
MNLNRVILVGRLAADPESRTTPTGQEVVSIRMATNRVWTDQAGQKQEQAEFHSVTLWGRLAQIASQYLKKGGLVMIEGRLQTRSWTGQDNLKRYKTEVVAENLQLGPRSANESGTRSYGNNNGYFQNSSPMSQKFTSQKPTIAAKEVADEEIPVINENEPINEPIISSSEIEEAEVDLKDIPF